MPDPASPYARPLADDELLAEQRDYYRQRAPEYDEWWQRAGRYDHGHHAAADWDAQVAVLDDALRAFGATGDVLELAGGTGWWTERLARTATTLTVVDASPETLERNRARVGGRPSVSYVVADLFAWEPADRYDVVFFSFWHSHVPRSRTAAFWGLVRRCLRPDGRVFLIDNRYDPSRSFVEHHIFEDSDGVQHRTLNDGSEHRLVKVFYEPDELTRLLAAEGWSAEIHATTLFLYGSVVRDGTEGEKRT